MHETRFGTALDKVRDRRRFLFELVIIAVALAICINIFSSAFLEILSQKDENSKFWWTCFIISGFGLFIAMIMAYCFASIKKVYETTFIGITLAFHIDPEKGQVTFLPCKDYEPAGAASTLYERIRKEINPHFVSGWPGPKEFISDAFGPGNIRWEVIAELFEAILIIMIREFGRRSLTHTAMYHNELRRFAGKIQEQTLKRETWPSRLSANRFLASRGVRHMLLPKWARLETPTSRPKYDGKQPERLIRLAAEYGNLTFAISPYWTRLRNWKTAAERFNLENSDQVFFLRIPLDIYQEMRGKFIPRKILYSNDSDMALQYFWFQTLVKNAFRRMDWGRHLRGEGGPADDD